MERRKVGFFSTESGVALTEALIIMPIMVLAVAVCVEFTHIMYQWNSAAKAMQLGARRLIVSDPVTTNFDIFDQYFSDTNTPGGALIPANSTVQSTCSGAANDCVAGRLDWLVNGGGAMWPGLKVYYPSIETSDITVTYELSGLGYNGRPSGPVVSVRLDMSGGPIDLPFLGGLLGIAGFTFPPFTVTATSEDLCSFSGVGC